MEHADAPRSACRGLIEGFYGPPWTRRDRLDLLTFCGERGMNAYVYAPKDDPKHRAQWREAYATDELDDFRELARHCRQLGMDFGFAVSPGLDIDYRSARDRSTLLAKLRAAQDLGVAWLVVAFDDLPGVQSQGAAQAALVGRLYEELRRNDPAARVSIIPTEYAGVTASCYLSDLAAGLPADVDVGWTGRWIVSPTITVADARARAAALGGRPPLLWDNYPVNDGHMARSLFLGPYTGREPGLAGACSGVLCNPMPLAHASKVPLATAAEFFLDGPGYRPEEAWARAISDVGGPHTRVLRTLAAACADSVLAPVAATDLHRLVDRYEAGVVSLTDLADHLLPATEPATLVVNAPEPVWAEVRPWVAQMHVEARAGLAAVHLLSAIEGASTTEITEAAQRLQEAWDRARRNDRLSVFGPRFASYPVATWGADGRQIADLSLGIVEDGSAIDRLCRTATRAYLRWSEEPGEAVGL